MRLQRVLALMASGVLRIIGPSAAFEPDPGSGRFRVSSPQVVGASEPVDVVIDAATSTSTKLPSLRRRTVSRRSGSLPSR